MVEKSTRMLSLGAGVQSTTVALLAVHGEIEKPEHAIFADTGWEPQEVYDHLEWLTPILESEGIKVHVVSGGNIRSDALNPKHNFASMPLHWKFEDRTKSALGRRQCTREYKITPVTKKQRELIGLKYRQRWTPEHGYVENLMGISVDEIQRAKDHREKWVKNVFPLLDLRMKRHDCLRWLDKHGYSAPRSACIGCPYHSDAEWLHIKENPKEWADAVNFDKELRESKSTEKIRMHKETNQVLLPFLHRSLVPLDQVDLRTVEEKGQFSLFDNECEGMCGL